MVNNPTILPSNDVLVPQKPDMYKRRIDKTIKFLSKEKLKEPILDIGENNRLAESVRKVFSVPVFNTTENLDESPLSVNNKYKTILCFEVLEHLYNPLFFLKNAYNTLTDDGILYLSTPYRQKIFWSKYHFNEIDDKRIRWLFDLAGFKIDKEDKIRLAGPLWFHLRGIRPIIRYFQYTRIYKLSKRIYV